jgi:hypothetical protein
MWIIIAFRLDLRSRAGFWKNDRAAVCAVRTIQYNNVLFYLSFIRLAIPLPRVSATVKRYLHQLQKLQRFCGFHSPLGTV